MDPYRLMFSFKLFVHWGDLGYQGPRIPNYNFLLAFVDEALGCYKLIFPLQSNKSMVLSC